MEPQRPGTINNLSNVPDKTGSTIAHRVLAKFPRDSIDEYLEIIGGVRGITCLETESNGRNVCHYILENKTLNSKDKQSLLLSFPHYLSKSDKNGYLPISILLECLKSPLTGGTLDLIRHLAENSSLTKFTDSQLLNASREAHAEAVAKIKSYREEQLKYDIEYHQLQSKEEKDAFRKKRLKRQLKDKRVI